MCQVKHGVVCGLREAEIEKSDCAAYYIHALTYYSRPGKHHELDYGVSFCKAFVRTAFHRLRYPLLALLNSYKERFALLNH